MRFRYLLFFTCFIYGLISTKAQTCVEFPEIDEESDDFDTEYHPITEDDVRPLGFMKQIVYFEPDADETDKVDPCFYVNGVDDKYVEILFETVPASVLCFEDQEGNKRCSDTRHQECIPAIDSTMTYTFYNDVGSGASEADITFWVRIYKGPPRSEDTENMWCQWRDNYYPEGQRALPDYVRPASTPRPASGAPTYRCPTLMLLAAALLATYSTVF